MSCCFNCADRCAGCHGVCDKYKAEQAVREEQRRKQRLQAAANQYFDEKKADIADYKRKGSKLTHMKGVHHK